MMGSTGFLLRSIGCWSGPVGVFVDIVLARWLGEVTMRMNLGLDSVDFGEKLGFFLKTRP